MRKSSSSSSDEEIKEETNQNPSEYYMDYHFETNSSDNYSLSSKIGIGRYSDVYEGTQVKTQEKVVVKILRPITKLKINREIYALQKLKECPNIVKITDVVKEENSELYCLVYKSISGSELKRFAQGIKPEDLKLYIYKILKCLEYTHDNGIIHRDIKAGNIVVNNETKELNVIDWGLAEHYIKDYKYTLTVGSRFYKSPELLLEYKKYDYAIDMWSLGCIYASLLFQIDYLFKGEDVQDQLVKVAEILGGEDIMKFLEKYQGECFLNGKIKKKIRDLPKRKWESFVNENNKYLISDDAIDLLNKLLEVDHQNRINAKDALNHPYFNSIYQNK